MNVIKFSKSLVVLNLSSNEITGDGMTVIFEAMGEQESINYLDISSHVGCNRNITNKKAHKALYNMLISNQYLENLKMMGISLGNTGMSWVIKAFDYGLEKCVEMAKLRTEMNVGIYIPYG